MSEVVFVGTSDAFGAGGRRQSAILLRASGGTALLDCGTTTNSGLRALGTDRDEIDTILISHFHGDHFGGIPLLLLAALYEDERRKPLWIAGPPGVESRVRSLAAAMGHPIEDREWGFPLHFEEFAVGRNAVVGPVKVSAFEAYHVPDSKPHGLRVVADGLTVAYSGDTGWFDELPLRVAGSDLFICECTYPARNQDFKYHLNYARLHERRKDFDCGRIILTHLGEEMSSRRGTFDLETADDGLTIRL
jgi:ribonuclease BN (tRNA processing enzyme)